MVLALRADGDGRDYGRSVSPGQPLLSAKNSPLLPESVQLNNGCRAYNHRDLFEVTCTVGGSIPLRSLLWVHISTPHFPSVRDRILPLLRMAARRAGVYRVFYPTTRKSCPAPAEIPTGVKNVLAQFVRPL